MAELKGPFRALALLDELDENATARYRPYCAMPAHLQAATGNPAAAAGFDVAIGLSEDDAVRRFLISRALAGGSGSAAKGPAQE